MAELVLGVDEDKTISFDVWNIGMIVHIENPDLAGSIMLSNKQVDDLQHFLKANYKEHK
jgi:hypothetical protein